MPLVPTRIACLTTAAVAIFSLISIAYAQIAATVEDQPITEIEIPQRTKFHEMATHKTPDRQSIIDELSNEIREIAQAQRRAVAPSDADVDKAFESVANNMAIDRQKLIAILSKGGASEATLKQQLRAGLAKNRLEHAGYEPHGGNN